MPTECSLRFAARLPAWKHLRSAIPYASCPVCGYAANTEKATSRLEPVVELEPTGDGTPELVHTPGCGAIADVAAFFKMAESSDIKCVAYMALKRGQAGQPDTWHGVAAFLRGDHQVNETKLLGAIGAAELRTMQGEELEKYFNGPAGFLGPVGLKPAAKPLEDGLTVVVDQSLEGRTNLVAGANKLDYHLRNVVPGRDFSYITRQRGMFSYSRLTAPQAIALREKYAVYALDSGRICVAALNSKNIDFVAECIAKVMTDV